MSIFSIFTGLLYNECFSVPMAWFGQGHWACPSDHSLNSRIDMHFKSNCPEAFNGGLDFYPRTPYPWGVDPTWHGTRTELQFLNSVKMKLSIVLGAPITFLSMLAPNPMHHVTTAFAGSFC